MTSTHFHTLIEYSNFNSVVNEIDPQGNYGLSWSFESQESSPRYASFFADPLEFSASLILFFSFILFYFHTSFNRVHFIFIFLIFISLFLSFSRGAIVACLGVVLFSLLIYKKYKILLSIFLLSIVFLFVLYSFSSDEIQYIIIDTIKFENTSSLGHLIEWIEGILSILENPLGIGLAMSGNAGGVDQSLKVGGENQFLILGVQMGAITLFIYTLILYYVIIRAIKTFQNSNSHQKHISYVVACSKFGLLLPLLTANAELYLFVSLATWFLAGNVESTYIKQLVEKKRVYIDVFYYKTALSGIKTYIEELVQGLNKYGRKDVEYIFSHDIEKLNNKQFLINSKYRLVRWAFQLRYLVWKQVILPIKLFSNSADVLICPDYVVPIFSPSRKIVVIHDNLLEIPF